MARARFHPIPDDGRLTLGDHRRYPGSRLVLTCTLCGWQKAYSPERAIDRLRQLKAGVLMQPRTRRQKARRIQHLRRVKARPP
jgi:RNase P subunit RPR2